MSPHREERTERTRDEGRALGQGQRCTPAGAGRLSASFSAAAPPPARRGGDATRPRSPPVRVISRTAAPAARGEEFTQNPERCTPPAR